MKKTLLSAALLAALGASTQANALLFNFNNGQGNIDVAAWDWQQTSFLAKNGNAAVTNRALQELWDSTDGAQGANVCPEGGDQSACQFTLYTHARLTGVQDADGESIAVTGLDSTFEITMTMAFVETVTGVGAAPGALGTTASFAIDTAEPAFLNVFHSGAKNSSTLPGFGFDDGTLILSSSTVEDSQGSFTITDATPVQMDQFPTGAPGSDNYGDGSGVAGASQLTISGSGSQDTISFSDFTQDNAFFKEIVTDFGVNFQNISIGLPFGSTNPADCFTSSSAGVAVGGTVANGAGQCNSTHTDALYSGQVHGGGLLPVVGDINGTAYDFSTNPDFVAQTDFNNSFNAVAVPEPNTVAILGLGLGLFGFINSRQRRKA